jgi:hypothetical protein
MNRDTAESLAAELYDQMPCRLRRGAGLPGSTELCAMEIVALATGVGQDDAPGHAQHALARLEHRPYAITVLAVALRAAHTALPEGVPIPDQWIRDLILHPDWGAVPTVAEALYVSGYLDQAVQLRALRRDIAWSEVARAARRASAPIHGSEEILYAAYCVDVADPEIAADYAAYAIDITSGLTPWSSLVRYVHHAVDSWSTWTGIDPVPPDVSEWMDALRKASQPVSWPVI